MLNEIEQFTRGTVIDEIHQRMELAKINGEPVPDEWRDWIDTLENAEGFPTIAEIQALIAGLPPMHIAAAEITWDSYEHFLSEIIDLLLKMVVMDILMHGRPDPEVKCWILYLQGIRKQFDTSKNIPAPGGGMQHIPGAPGEAKIAFAALEAYWKEIDKVIQEGRGHGPG